MFQDKSTVKEWLSISVLLLAALSLRLTFFTGVARGGDSLNYAHAAYALSKGVFQYDAWVGMSYVGLYTPVAFLYWLFGPNQITTLAFPLMFSLLSVVFIYAIAKLHMGKAAGLAAALIWAFLPLDVYLGTSLLPDGPLAAFSTGAVYFFLLASRDTTQKKAAYYGLSVFLLGWAILIKPLAIITFIYILVAICLRLWPAVKARLQMIGRESLNKIVAISMILLLASLVVVYYSTAVRPVLITLDRANNDLGSFFFTGSAELDFDVDFMRSDLLVFVAPLFFVAFLMLVADEKITVRPILLWAAVLFLYYEWGSVSLNPFFYDPMQPFQEARNMLFLLAPFVVLAGIYIGRRMKDDHAQWVLPAIGILASVIAYFAKPQLYSGGWTIWTSAAGLLLIIASLISPYGFSPTRSLKFTQTFATVLLFALCLGMLQPFLPYHALMFEDRLNTLDNLQQIESFWEENQDYPIYASDPLTLNYATEFRLGYKWADVQLPDTQFRIRSEPIPAGQSGYVVRTRPTADTPMNWWPQYNSSNNDVQIFRVLNRREAQMELDAAIEGVDIQYSMDTLERLYGAGLNALSWEHIFPTWVDLHAYDPNKYSLDELFNRVSYFIQTHPYLLSKNEFENSDFSIGLEDWFYLDPGSITLHPEAAATIQVSGETSGLSQEVILQPNQIYFFSVHISTSQELLIDVLNVNNGAIPDTFAHSEMVNNPVEISAVFVTPDWGEPQKVPIELYVPNGKGRVWLQGPTLVPVLAK